MATINLSSIQDFCETALNYCGNKLREITPIVPYTFIHLKQVFYAYTKNDELFDLRNKSRKSYAKNIPDYALADIDIDFESMRQVNHPNSIISNGIYYIVLVDLVGSTKYLAKFGNERAAERIIVFVQTGVEVFIRCEKVNQAYFLKEIGDSVLFIFTHVSDVVQWHEAFNSKLSEISQYINDPYEIRTCVHLGEVCLHDANPLCLSVSETFKMEKLVEAGKLVFSELAAKVAAPTLNGSNFKLAPYKNTGNLQELIFDSTYKKAPS